MSYRTPEPTLEAFADPAQQSYVRRVSERLDNLEQVTQAQSVGSAGRQAPAPPKAGFGVTTNAGVKGHAYVRITNPEFLGGKQNQAGSAIRHHLQASTNPQFNGTVTDFPVSHQTYYDISELGSGTFYFRMSSSYDGKTFNTAQNSGKVVIP